MARYLLIDVKLCARSRKHILSKRKHVHTDQNGNSHLQTNAICGKIDIHITVLTIEVYENKSAYAAIFLLFDLCHYSDNTIVYLHTFVFLLQQSRMIYFYLMCSQQNIL